MQARMPNPIKLIKNIESGRKFPKEVVPYLLQAVETADYKTKSEIENQIVKIGKDAIQSLIDALASTKGTARAVAAMSLIRIGGSSLEPLKTTYKNNPELGWVVNYIVNEIEGTKRPLRSVNQQEILVG